MPLSLQDQLKKSGLIDDKKAKQLKRAKNKQEKLARKTKNPAVDQPKLELDRAMAEKKSKVGSLIWRRISKPRNMHWRLR